MSDDKTVQVGQNWYTYPRPSERLHVTHVDEDGVQAVYDDGWRGKFKHAEFVRYFLPVLPPAPLPADVAAELARLRARVAEFEALADMANDCRKDQGMGADDWEVRIALDLAALAQPAAPMTEAEQAEEATDGRR